MDDFVYVSKIDDLRCFICNKVLKDVEESLKHKCIDDIEVLITYPIRNNVSYDDCKYLVPGTHTISRTIFNKDVKFNIILSFKENSTKGKIYLYMHDALILDLDNNTYSEYQQNLKECFTYIKKTISNYIFI